MRAMVAGTWMEVTPHAIDRYIERVKSHLTFGDASEELRRMLPMAVLERDLAWTAARTEDSFAVLGDGIAFPVVNRVLVSCITRSSVGAQIRLVRQAERRRTDPDGFRRKGKKQHGKVARDARRRAREGREAAFE